MWLRLGTTEVHFHCRVKAMETWLGGEKHLVEQPMPFY